LQAYEEVKKAEDKLRRLNASLEQRVEERTKELYESEERLRLVSRATNDAVWDWNLMTNNLWWNEGFQKLFGYSEEEFKRFHTQVEGTGIGLYMVKRIVENNEGSIEVESQENKGTTFRVYLKDMKTGD
jgi:PAS domain S-box-containing protein